MRTLVLALALLLVPATAQAGGAVRSVLTLAGAYVGGAAGVLVGTTAYGVTDPYGHNNSGEYLYSGGVAGLGLGAAIGGGLTHSVIGGRKGGRVLVVCGLVGGVAAAGALYAPALHEDGALSDSSMGLVIGAAALGGVGVPILSMAMSGILGSRGDDEVEAEPDVTLVPAVGSEFRGLSLVVRI